MAFPGNPYTERARGVLSVAHGCAYDANLDEVCPAHILVALANGDRGVARGALESLSIDLTAIQDEIPVPSRQAPRVIRPAILPLDASATHLIAFGKEEGTNLSLGRYFGTEHLLLGLMRLTDDAATTFLLERSVTLDDVRAAINSLLTPESETGKQ
jgi:ATP-dependent Clp protease ATP-binding subunit ClpA